MSQHPGQRLPPTLRHWRDWQSVFYMLILPLIVWWQWSHGFNLILYGIELPWLSLAAFIAIAVSLSLYLRKTDK